MIFALLKSILSAVIFSCIASIIYLNIFITPINTVTVIKNKTSGWQKEIFTHGYHWLWNGFVPNQWNFFNVHLQSTTQVVNFTSPLKYAEYLKKEDLLKFLVQLKFNYTIDPNNILPLVEALDVNIKNLDMYIHEEIQSLMTEQFIKITNQTSTNLILFKNQINEYLNTSFINDCNKILKHNGIILSNLKISKFYLPDYEVYLFHLKSLEAVQKTQTNNLLKIIEADGNAYSQRLRNQIEIEKIYQIKELIKQEPKILDYLKYQNLNPNTQVLQLDHSHLNTNEDKTLLNTLPNQNNNTGVLKEIAK